MKIVNRWDYNMPIRKFEQPSWVLQEIQNQQMNKPNQVQQQRTIIPASQLTGINTPPPQQSYNPRNDQFMGDSQLKPMQLDGQYQDSIPSILRGGEEIITPEIVNAMGGHQSFVDSINEKLAPQGIQLRGGKPVEGGQPESQSLQGTLGEMNNQNVQPQGVSANRQGFASGTIGSRLQKMTRPEQPSNRDQSIGEYLQTNTTPEVPGNRAPTIGEKINRRKMNDGTLKPVQGGISAANPNMIIPSNADAHLQEMKNQIKQMIAMADPKIDANAEVERMFAQQQAQQPPQAPLQARSGFAKGTMVPMAGNQPQEQSGGIMFNPRITNSQQPRKPFATGTTDPTNTNTTTSSSTAQTTPATTTNTTNSTTGNGSSTPVTAGDTPQVSDATKGIGFKTDSTTQSDYYAIPAKAASEQMQQQNAVSNMQTNQNMAQAGISGQSAQAKTANAQNQAQQESTKANTLQGIATTAQGEIATDTKQTISTALAAGDFATVNSALSKAGQKTIDFTQAQNKITSGNLTDAANTLISEANGITGTDAASVAAKSALLENASALNASAIKTVANLKLDPAAAVKAAQSTDETDPVVKAMKNVTTTISTWASTDPTGAISQIEQSQAGQGLILSAQQGNEASAEELGRLVTASFRQANKGVLTDDQTDLLNKYGANVTTQTVTAANQEAV
jgi:hypothetical protein